MQTCFHKIPQILEFRKMLIRRTDPYLKEVPYRLVSFLMELFNAPFSSRLLKNSGNKYFLFLSFFFFILNITASCKHNRQISSNIVIHRLVGIALNGVFFLIKLKKNAITGVFFWKFYVENYFSLPLSVILQQLFYAWLSL